MTLTILALLLHIMESKKYQRASSIEDVLVDYLFENPEVGSDIVAILEQTSELSNSTIYTLLCLAGFKDEIGHYKEYSKPNLDGYAEAVVYYILREALNGIHTIGVLRNTDIIDLKTRLDSTINHVLTLDLFNEI